MTDGTSSRISAALANEDRIRAIMERTRDEDRDELIRYGRADTGAGPIGAAAARGVDASVACSTSAVAPSISANCLSCRACRKVGAAAQPSTRLSAALGFA